MKSMERKTIIAAIAAIGLGVLTPRDVLPAWLNLVVGAVSITCGAVALYGAIKMARQ